MRDFCDVCHQYGEIVTVFRRDFSQTKRCMEHLNDPEDFVGRIEP